MIDNAFFDCGELVGGFVSLLWLASDHIHLYEEWTRYLAGLRQTHARKPRLLQTLARLEGRKIVDEK
jgi:hypothetical protein